MSGDTTVSINGGPAVAMEVFEAAIKELEKRHSLPQMGGKLLKAILRECCLKQGKDDPSGLPQYSFGVGSRSVVATDGMTAICVGGLEEGYLSTSKEESLIEAERGAVYRKLCNLGSIPLLEEPDKDTGELKNVPFPNVRPVLAQTRDMKHVCTVDPSLLLSAAKLADASGASTIDLFLPHGDDPKMIGFGFRYSPEQQASLFEEGDTLDPVTVLGVLATRQKRAKATNDDLKETDDGE